MSEVPYQGQLRPEESHRHHKVQSSEVHAEYGALNRRIGNHIDSLNKYYELDVRRSFLGKYIRTRGVPFQLKRTFDKERIRRYTTVLNSHNPPLSDMN